MKTIEEKKAELIAYKKALLLRQEEEIKAIKDSYNTQLVLIDKNIDLLDRAFSLLSDESKILELSGSNSSEVSESNGQQFAVKGSMSVREGIIEALKTANKPLHLDDIMKALENLNVVSDRGSVRARITKSVQTGELKRVADATYELAESDLVLKSLLEKAKTV